MIQKCAIVVLNTGTSGHKNCFIYHEGILVIKWEIRVHLLVKMSYP